MGTGLCNNTSFYNMVVISVLCIMVSVLVFETWYWYQSLNYGIGIGLSKMVWVLVSVIMPVSITWSSYQYTASCYWY